MDFPEQITDVAMAFVSKKVLTCLMHSVLNDVVCGLSAWAAEYLQTDNKSWIFFFQINIHWVQRNLTYDIVMIQPINEFLLTASHVMIILENPPFVKWI